jgi:hypothetical protein
LVSQLCPHNNSQLTPQEVPLPREDSFSTQILYSIISLQTELQSNKHGPPENNVNLCRVTRTMLEYSPSLFHYLATTIVCSYCPEMVCPIVYCLVVVA